jgi:hypothetical protein
VVHVGISNAGKYIFAAAKSLITGTVSDDYSTYSFTSNRSALPYASGIATADLNGDGVGDLVVVNSGLGVANAYVAVMLGNADGTFKAPVSYPTAGAASVAATIDDVNGDGIPDLIVASDDRQGRRHLQRRLPPQLSPLLRTRHPAFRRASPAVISTTTARSTSWLAMAPRSPPGLVRETAPLPPAMTTPRLATPATSP